MLDELEEREVVVLAVGLVVDLVGSEAVQSFRPHLLTLGGARAVEARSKVMRDNITIS